MWPFDSREEVLLFVMSLAGSVLVSTGIVAVGYEIYLGAPALVEYLFN